MKAGRKDHSSNLFVAEARLLPAIDDWLGQLTDPERIDETVEVIVVADSDRVLEPPQVRRARRTIAVARGRLEHLMAGLEVGLGPEAHCRTDPACAGRRSRRRGGDRSARPGASRLR